MGVYAIEGVVPVVHPEAFVHPEAVLHGCTVRSGAMVGMNAVVMDGADIGSRALVAANAFIPAGLVVPADHLAAGNPGKVIKELDADALAWKANGIRVYQELARRSLASLVAVVPLAEVEPGRPSLSTTKATSVPLHEFRRRTD